MKRIMAAAMLSLLAAQAAAASDRAAEEQCASVFLSERMSPQEAAVMMKLWGIDPGKVPMTTLAAETGYDAEMDDLAASAFLKMMGEYQMRCPTSGLEFE